MGKGPLAVVHIDPNDMVMGYISALSISWDTSDITDYFRELRSILKEKNVQMIFSEILPVP